MVNRSDVNTVVEVGHKEDFDNIVLQSPKPVVVDFWAPWCMPCRMQSPIMDDCAKEWGSKAVGVKVNVDLLPKLADQLKIVGIPSIIVFQDGREINRFTGVISKKTHMGLIRV